MSRDDSNTPPEDNRDSLEKAVDRIADAFNKVADKTLAAKPEGEKSKHSAATEKFFKAVKNNRLHDVRDLIAAGVDPNEYDKSGYTALHIAARGNLGEMITLLAEAGAITHLGKKNDPQRTPLEDAVNYGSNEAAAALARLGGFVPGQRVNGWSLLHRATEKGKAPAVAALLAAGADANERTENGSTPLLIAIQRRQPEVTLLLLDHPAVIDGMNNFFADTDDSQRNAFHLAVERGEAPVVRKMIDKGAYVNKPDANGESPLEKAVLGGHIEIVRMLVQAGADLDKPTPGKETPLMIAVTASEIRDETARAAIVSFLMKQGADPDIVSPLSGMTPLHAALLSRDGMKTVQSLLQQPVGLEIQDRDGCPPLFYALRKQGEEMLSLLLERGANPNARNANDARTPLIEAAQAGFLNGVAALLNHGANPALCDAANKSALFYARKNAANSGVVDLLEKALLARHKKEKQRMEKKSAPKNGHWTF